MLVSLYPYDLRTERTTNPLGIDDPTPVLGWKLASVGHARRQLGYRIVVTEQHDAKVGRGDEMPHKAWDSGFVRSAEQVDVAYGGEPLRERTRYRWWVRVRDEHGNDSEWSQEARFETGSCEWPASWISAPFEPMPAHMLDVVQHPKNVEQIWLSRCYQNETDRSNDRGESEFGRVGHDEQVDAPDESGFLREPARFRAVLDISDDRPVEHVTVLADTAAARIEWIRVNDCPVAFDGTDVGAAFVPGTNTIEIAVTPELSTDYAPSDSSDAREATGLPSLVARVEVGHSSGRPTVLGTDASWRCRPERASSWSPAESLGPHGGAPLGRSTLTHRPSPLLRRDVELPGPIVRARLYATALGLYEARINGVRVSDQVLAPGWTDYRHRLEYQTYDVTELVHEGNNTLAAVLADGWYAGHVGWLGRHLYGDTRAFRAYLVVWHSEGRRTIIGTDQHWRAGRGEIRYADLQQGEVVDLRRRVSGWDRPGFDDTGWESVHLVDPRHGRVVAAIGPPIRVQRRVHPQSVHRKPDGRLLVDFGQNLLGWVRLRVRGPAGARVLFRHAEALDHNGELYTTALRTARAIDEFWLAGRVPETETRAGRGVETGAAPDTGAASDADTGTEFEDGCEGDTEGEWLEPRFTVHGFRYAEIDAPTLDPDLIDEITAAVVHAELPSTGEFACSDPRLERLHQNIRWSQRGNFLAVPTDCPQRDERLGWTGDAQVFASTAMFGYDTRTFFRKWLADIIEAQHSDGGVPHVVPDLLTMVNDRPKTAGGAGWADVIAVLPYELYWAYGDRRAVADCYPAVCAWLDYLERNSAHGIRPDERFGDHLALVDTPRDLVNTAWYAHAARLAGRLAEALDRGEDALAWEQVAARVREAFRDRYVTGGGTIVSGTQAAYALALHFDLFDSSERAAAARNLVDDLAARNWHVTTGFLGTPFLLPVLARFGHLRAAYRLLTNESFPSWLYPIVHGEATTMWERWDSWNDAHGFADPGMTSLNHYAYGAVGEWMYRTIGGLAPGAPGYRHVLVRPLPGGGVRHARTALDTPYGPVSVQWWQRDRFELEVRIPPNTTAEVWLPGTNAAEQIGPGRHRFAGGRGVAG